MVFAMSCEHTQRHVVLLANLVNDIFDLTDAWTNIEESTQGKD